MSRLEIRSGEDLETWLNNQPREFAQVIAARAALRVLPFAFAPSVSDDWVIRNSLSIFRTCAISWAARNLPDDDLTAPSFAAHIASVAFGMSSIVGDACAEAAYAAATFDAEVSVSAAFIASKVVVASVSIPDVDADDIWGAVSVDTHWLQSASGDPRSVSQKLTRSQLWLQGQPAWFNETWKHARTRLAHFESSYRVWIKWFDRRIAGVNCAFPLPRKADGPLQLRVFNSENGWWERGPAAVNADIAAWIKEARSSVSGDEIDSSDTVDNLAKLPTQNPNSLTFRETASGKVGLDPRVRDPELLRDEASQDRHAEARDEAQRLLALAQGSNAAQRLVGPLERYLAAIGKSIDDLRPGLVTQRGERLRQFLADYETDTSDPDLEPLPREVLSTLKAVRSAHNVMVGIDPLLRRMDSALLGPDVKPALIAPDELRGIAVDADQANLLEEGVRVVLEEAASLSPAIPDPSNRRSVWSGEAALNLTIELLAMALSNPVKTSAGLVIASTLVATLPTGVTIVGSGFSLVGLCFVLKKREARLLQLLERHPACQAMLRDLLSRVMPEDKDRKA